jgi:hypothetical protein
MPDLNQSLQNQDIGHLRIVAELWGVELISPGTEAALKEISAALLDAELVTEIVEALPTSARAALEALTRAGGKLTWAAFTRQFGELRLAGPGRRDREQVYLHPTSAAEILFYRALLARAFFDTSNGAQEFAYIPDDLLKFIKPNGHIEHQGKSFESIMPVGLKNSEPLGRPASPKEREHPIPASDRLLDDATTLLAALRMNIDPPETSIPMDVVSGLLRAAGILAGNDPRAEKVKSFLEIPRQQALSELGEAWVDSETFNELRQVPGLICDGEWSNQPLVTREFVLSLLDVVPEEKWWSLTAFVRAVKEKYPDFQRPAGDYDSWFIKCAEDGAYLRGFATWDEVDGALINYLITGPLTWLGMVELAMPEESEIITAFRVRSNNSRHTTLETGKLAVTSSGKISVPRFVPRTVRYQIARFCEWDVAKPDEYRYRVTTTSLKRAGEQGLKVNQLLSLLAKNAAAEIPPAFIKALKRWEMNGTEARVEVQTVLKVSKPEVLEELRKSKAGRFLGESLGPVTVVVKPGAQSKVLAALAELGLLAENLIESGHEKES